ncbi:MAG: hypothetical protein ABIG71_03220 [Candidatus Uhrbacteria bacterium]
MQQVTLSLALSYIVGIVVIVWAVRHVMDVHGHMTDVETIPEQGVRIPVYAIRTAVRGHPFVVFGTYNSLNPVLRILPDRIEYRLAFRRSRLFADIESVAFKKNLRSYRIIITFRGERKTLVTYTLRRETVQTLMRWLTQKGVQVLGGDRMERR